MNGVNKVILVGTLGKDPEVKMAANGNAIANLAVATSEQWTDKSTGQKQEKTEWHRAVIFGKLAEIAGQYLTKGSHVYLEGKIKTRKWTDQATGQERYATEVVLDYDGKLQMLGGGQSQAPQGQAPQQGRPMQGQPMPQRGQPMPQQGQPMPQQGQPAPQVPMQGQGQQAPMMPPQGYGQQDNNYVPY